VQVVGARGQPVPDQRAGQSGPSDLARLPPRFSSGRAIYVSLLIRNAGNIHRSYIGPHRIVGTAGAKTRLPDITVLGDSQRTITARWPDPPPLFCVCLGWGCFLGDRPTALAWLGICVTVPALWLVSGGGVHRGSRMPTGQASVDGLIASLGVAVQYLGLAQTDPVSGLWPVAVGRFVAVILLIPSAWRHARRFRQPWPRQAQAVVIGGGAALALILYLWAAQQEILAIAVVLASLYPAIPTILGLAVLREKATRAQVTGLVSAAAAIILLTLG
jgi:drug/metabolite transporter (DMT)-like permease